jgi:hypothetical protein
MLQYDIDDPVTIDVRSTLVHKRAAMTNAHNQAGGIRLHEAE